MTALIFHTVPHPIIFIFPSINSHSRVYVNIYLYLQVYCIFMGVPLLLQVLVAIGSFLILTTIAAFVLVLCRISAKRRYQRRLSSASVPESVTFDPTDLNRIEMGELIIATKDFSPELIIGDGSFGLVYKAKLSSGLQVAVKKLSADAFQGFREFQAEMDTLGKIRHPNIVKMFGYCSTGLDRVLIYELGIGRHIRAREVMVVELRHDEWHGRWGASCRAAHHGCNHFLLCKSWRYNDNSRMGSYFSNNKEQWRGFRALLFMRRFVCAFFG
nr:leucine-rich repeat receptor protein kinase EMS1 [Ipomoea batatas]